MTESKILEKFKLTEEENKFIAEANSNQVPIINATKIISNLYLSKTIEQSTSEIIKSNKELSISNNKYAKGMLWLTGGLVFVGIVQIITQAIQIYLSR